MKTVPGHVEQELVAVGHRPQESAQLQVAAQVGLVRRQVPLEIEIPVRVHQEGFHQANRSFSCR
jgi:hypothetical protein